MIARAADISTRHISLIQCSAFLASTNPKTSTGSCSPRRRRPRLFQDLALLREDLDLATQPAQLVALVAAQALGLALIDVTLARPVPERLRRDAELLGQLRDGLPLLLSNCTASRLNSLALREELVVAQGRARAGVERRRVATA